MDDILPGVSIEVRPEGLIAAGQVSISTLGVVGTASRGTTGDPRIVGTAADARAAFGDPDAYDLTNVGNELTLVRALEIAFDHGARDVIAVRVQNETPGNTAVAARFVVPSAGGDCCTLMATSPGTWGNDLGINIRGSSENATIVDERHGGGAVTLTHRPIAPSARTRISILRSGSTTPVSFTPIFSGTVASGQVLVDATSGALTFFTGEGPGTADAVLATYFVDAADTAPFNVLRVTLTHGATEEQYLVVSGRHLADQLEDSALARRDPAVAITPNIDQLPTEFSAENEFRRFSGGTNGEEDADYSTGLDALLDQNAHIIVAAGQDHTTVGATLMAHVEQASSDLNKRERIGVIGSAPGEDLDEVLGHTLDSGRIVFVAPGITVLERASNTQVTLPGSYAAAAVAGMISGFPVNRSLTNKPVSVAGLETTYTTAELRQLVQARVLAIEKRLGFRTVKGITTATNTAYHQITTVRIVDKAKFGVRSAANPYIGLLNNSRVRAALQSTIEGFLTGMVLDEELISFDLNVTATRAEEIRGIVRVTMTLRPVFSIDFIKVTMFLE